MVSDPVFVLVSKDKAKDSFEARKLVEIKIEDEIRGFLSPPYPLVGGNFSGLLSNLCGDKAIIPYYNKELRDLIRNNIPKFVPDFKKFIETAKNKTIYVSPSEIKKEFPLFDKYNDAELLDALRLELAPMGLDVDFGWSVNYEILYVFTNIPSYTVTPDLRENGRDASLELGYEDDAMIINECLYREVIDKMKDKIIDVDNIGKDVMALAAKGWSKKIRPADVIGKKWIVLVDYRQAGEQV